MKKLMALVLSAFVAVSCFGEGDDPEPGDDFYTTYMTARTSRVPPEPGRVPAQLIDFRMDYLQDADKSGTETNTYRYGSFATDFAHDYYSPKSRNFRTLQHFIDWLDWRLLYHPPLDEFTLNNRWKWLFQPYPNGYEQSTLGIFDWIDDNGPYVQGTNILAGYNDATHTIHSEDPNHFWQWGPYLYGTSISGASNGASTKLTFHDLTYGPFLLGMGIWGSSNGFKTIATLNDGTDHGYGPFLLGMGIKGASNNVVTTNTLTDGDNYGPFLLGTAIKGASNGVTTVATVNDGSTYGPFLLGTGIKGASNNVVTTNTLTDGSNYGPFLLGTAIRGASNGVTTVATIGDGSIYGPFLLGLGIKGASNNVVTTNTLTDGSNYGPFLLGTAIMGASNGTTSVSTCSNGVYGPFLVGIGILGGTSTGTVVNTYATNGYGPFLMGTNINGGEYVNGQWEVSAGLYPDAATRLWFSDDGVTTNKDFIENKAFRYVFRGAVWYESTSNNDFSYDIEIRNMSALTNSETSNTLHGVTNGVMGNGVEGWLHRPVVFRGLRHYTAAYNRDGLASTATNKIQITKASFDKIASSYATLLLRAGSGSDTVYGLYTVMSVSFSGNYAVLTLDRYIEAGLNGTGRFFLCGEIGQFGLPAGANRFVIRSAPSAVSDKHSFRGVVRATSRKRNPWTDD